MTDETAEPEHDDDNNQKGTRTDNYVATQPKSIWIQDPWAQKNPISWPRQPCARF